MRYWIKLYTEIISDPKMGRLSDRQFRTCINLFALAGEVDHEGALPPLADMAWHLRMSDETLSDDLQELANVGIVELDDDDCWRVRKWQDRQAKPPSAAPDKILQRVHEHRARQRNETTAECNESVTNLKQGVTPSEKRREEERREETEKSESDAERAAALTPGPTVAHASTTRTTAKPNPKLSAQVNLFAAVTGYFPPRPIHHMIDSAIAEDADQPFLRECYETWLARGYKRENIAWLTEWYASGNIPQLRKNGNAPPPAPSAAELLRGYDVPAGYEGLVKS
jgi:hypothetical protein